MMPKNFDGSAHSERALFVLVMCLAAGCLVIPFYAAQASSIFQFVSISGVAFLVAFSALLAGGLLGFLFGIPRTLQQQEKPAGQESADVGTSEPEYVINTNLEQISDWLTKILVGVGLTQIASIPSSLRRVAEYIGPGLGNFDSSRVFAVALLLFCLIDGFLIGYLWTRIYMLRILRKADSVSRMEVLEDKLNTIDIDAKAWSSVQRMLNPLSGSAVLSQKELNAAIAQATSDMKARIFWEARRFRSANREDDDDKPAMERTIPIFRALIASDVNDEYHANHGQLGYALKDKVDPDWAEAEAELAEAILLRGDAQTSGWWPMYELVRAICRIELDEAYAKRAQSREETKEAILADLKIAGCKPEVEKKIRNDQTIQDWMAHNNIAEF